MPLEGKLLVPRRRKPLADVFLNIPYDTDFQNLYLAYISGICAFGLIPRATLEIPGGARRLDRIWRLIKSCRYAVHDLSRVELDQKRPPTPRFNMPFELGLSVAWEEFARRKHTWFVFEAKNRRLQKSLSDLNGTDTYIHDGRVAGVFRELCNAFNRPGLQPSVQHMWEIYAQVQKNVPSLLKLAGTESVFQTRTFRDICLIANAVADELIFPATH